MLTLKCVNHCKPCKLQLWQISSIDRNMRLQVPNDSVAFLRATLMFNKLAADNEKTNISIEQLEVYDRKRNRARYQHR